MRERQTDKTDRRVTEDDVTSGSHKSIAQTNGTNELAQNMMMSRPGMEMMKQHMGCTKATQVHMDYLRLVNLKEICPSQRVGHFKAPC